MEKMSIVECRDKLLMNGITCHSKYRERGDSCRYCELDFSSVGVSCRAKEMWWRHELNNRFHMEDVARLLPQNVYTALDVFTVVSMCNQEQYFSYFGETAVRDEWTRDKALTEVIKILEQKGKKITLNQH